MSGQKYELYVISHISLKKIQNTLVELCRYLK